LEKIKAEVRNVATQTPPTPPPAKEKTQIQLIKEEVGKLYETHGGQLHLRDILSDRRQGAPVPLCNVSTEDGKAILEWPNLTINGPIFTEDRTKKLFTVVQVPVNLLSVDEDVNPRHLQRARLEKMVEAFRSGQTRFQVTQCRLLPRDNRDELAAFDGSHGTASEILASGENITCKVYLPSQLSAAEAFEWNTDAHSSLRQQEFRSRVLMSRRAKIFKEDFEKFLQDPGRGTFPRSERGFIASLPAYERAQKLESIFDYVYSAVLEDVHEVEYEDASTGETKTMLEPACKIQEFVRKDEQQKRGGKLLGYDLLKATILKEFVQQGASEKVVTRLSREDWPRELERANLVRLDNILAEEMLEGRWGETHDVEIEQDGKKRAKKIKEPTAEAVVAENLWKKGPVRIWSRRLRDAIGLMLRLASSDLETIFQRTIPKEVWDQIREGVKRIASYGGWGNDKVIPLLGGNVVGEIERALDDWADVSTEPRLDAYYLAGQERP
jgi:hypothetical protein